MRFTQKQTIILLGGALLIVIFIVIVAVGGGASPKPPAVSLVLWLPAAGDGLREGFFDAMTARYKAVRPNVEMRLEWIPAARYRDTVVNALAAGTGPDIFAIGNRALPKEQEKLAPVFPEQMGLARLRDLFPTVVEQDFARGDDIYALPLYLDTLALIYNRDAFDQAGIVESPRTWDDVQNIVPRLRELTPTRQIAKAALAMGGTEATVHAAADLVSLLMMQNGAQMTDDGRTRALFAQGGIQSPGLEAFVFYLQFANSASSVYTWNDSREPDIEGFAGGRVPMIFGYAGDAQLLRERSPFLRTGVALMPQPSGSEVRLDYARYEGLAVPRQSQNPGWAWDFIVYATTDKETAKLYTDGSGRPPALRSLVKETLEDPDRGVWSKQALTARSWHQADAERIREIITNAIRRVHTGAADPGRALREAEDQVTQLMRVR